MTKNVGSLASQQKAHGLNRAQADNRQHNTPGILDIAKLTTSEVAEFGSEDLAELQAELDRRLKALAACKKKLEAALAMKYEPVAVEAYKEKGVDTGSAHFEADGVGLEMSRSKTVEWEQKGLLGYLDTLPVEDARHMADFKVSIPEVTYKGALPAIQRQLNKHRKVKVGNTKFKFEQVED